MSGHPRDWTDADKRAESFVEQRIVVEVDLGWGAIVGISLASLSFAFAAQLLAGAL